VADRRLLKRLARGDVQNVRFADLCRLAIALGFEPRADPGAVTLHNCPFHALAARHTELVCGLNHAFLSGLVDGLGVTDSTPVLAPRAGRCCVELRAR